MFFRKKSATSIITEQLGKVRKAITGLQSAIELNQSGIEANKETIEKLGKENMELHSENIFANRLLAKLSALVEE